MRQLFGKIFGRRKLSDELRIALALRAAAYMRWIELRERRTPGDHERTEWIKGMLDAEKLPNSTEEIYAIDIVALTLDIDGVDEFARQQNYFELLDRAAAQYKKRSQ